MCRLCVSLERKGATLVILIHFESLINFGASSTLIITTTIEFYVNLSFISAGKAGFVFKVLCCQECQKPNAIHSYSPFNCSKISGFPDSKLSLLGP